MKSTVQILVIDGNTRATNLTLVEAGGQKTGEGYAAVLGALQPGCDCIIVRPADHGADCLPDGMTLDCFDGYVITGSGLNAYDDIPQVNAQKELVANAFESGTPGFGSCWGLQIMCAALGGTVSLNPKGREVPFGRAITLNKLGRAHPLFKGKPDRFDSVAIHMDEVSELPDGATLLASNQMSTVQAVEIKHGQSVFWGVQYHPEFGPGEISAYLQLRKEAIVAEKVFDTEAEVDVLSEGLRELESDPHGPARRALGLDDMIINFDDRTREIRNWLETLVMPGKRS